MRHRHRHRRGGYQEPTDPSPWQIAFVVVCVIAFWVMVAASLH